MDREPYIPIVEALILASTEPLPAPKILELIGEGNGKDIDAIVQELNQRYELTGTSFRIRQIAGGYQIYIRPEFTGYVEEMFTRRRKMRMTQPALETLAIIAYRQPVTKTEIEHIRGVASDGVLHTLLEKDLIAIKGRAKGVGKALQYGTTDEFLKLFGLNSLEDLPKMSEIEELIAVHRSNNQTELGLEDGMAAALSQKLNVADGTFDPRKLHDESIEEAEVVLDVHSESSDPDDAQPFEPELN